MLPLRESNPSDGQWPGPGLEGRSLSARGDGSRDSILQERITELEARTVYLQSLVVELLDKNEQLRRKTGLLDKNTDPA